MQEVLPFDLTTHIRSLISILPPGQDVLRCRLLLLAKAGKPALKQQLGGRGGGDPTEWLGR